MRSLNGLPSLNNRDLLFFSRFTNKLRFDHGQKTGGSRQEAVDRRQKTGAGAGGRGRVGMLQKND